MSGTSLRMPIHQRLKIPLGLFFLTVLTRLPFADTMLYNLDSGHFALALGRFDVAVHQPHPPGYFLYVMLGRLARIATGDANTALVLISILFSGLMVVVLYYMGDAIYGRTEGFAAALIGFTSPLAWFHSVVGLSYSAEGFFSILTAYLCFRILKGEARLLWLSAVVLGVSGGIRQNSFVFLLPLWLFSIRRQGPKRCLLAFLVLTVTLLSWFLPMLHMTGGYERYSEALDAQVSGTVWHGVALSRMLEHAWMNLYFVAWGLFAAMLPLGLYILRKKGRETHLFQYPASPGFFLFWLIPSMTFYLIVFTNPNAPGYSLVYLAGLYILAGRALCIEADRLPKNLGIFGRRPGFAWTVLAAVILMANTLAFMFMDFPFSLKGLDKHNRQLTAFLGGLKNNFPPDKTAVIGSENFYISYRHVCYYLPDYLVYYTPENVAPSKRRCMSCRNRDTRILPRIDIPSGTEYLVRFQPRSGPLPYKAKELGAQILPVYGGDYLVYYDYRKLIKRGIPIEDILQ